MVPATREEIREHFIEPLTALGFVIRAPNPRFFVTTLVKTLHAERVSVDVFKRAVERVSSMRTSQTFPNIAQCRIECRLAAEVIAGEREEQAASPVPEAAE